MIGFLFFTTIAVWLWVCNWLSQVLSSMLPMPSWRSAVRWGTLIALLASPFVDEVIGMYQFEGLCKSNGIESADVSMARGRQVKVGYGERTQIQGTIMPILTSEVQFKDASTGEVLIRHKNYYALGGWLMRNTPLSMGSDHSMFSGNGCGFALREQIFQSNQITEVN